MAREPSILLDYITEQKEETPSASISPKKIMEIRKAAEEIKKAEEALKNAKSNYALLLAGTRPNK